MHRDCASRRAPATMRTGVLAVHAHERLNALLVVCHGWKSPARLPLPKARALWPAEPDYFGVVSDTFAGLAVHPRWLL